MKMFTWWGRTLLLVAVVVIGFGWLSNVAAQGAGLVGHWIFCEGHSGKAKSIELFKDGTGVVDEMSVKWKIEGKRLVMLSALKGISCDYKISGYELTLFNDDGNSALFVRKEKLEEYKNKKEEEKKKEQERMKLEAERKKLEVATSVEKMTTYFTDSRDGQKYGAIMIGRQKWMTQNLNYQTGNSWCYGDDISKCQQYGRLYDWNTASTACPSGWHLPTAEEWDGLIVTAVGKETFGNPNKIEKLKSTSGWDEFRSEYGYNKIDGNGTNEYGFSAIPGGDRNTDGRFRGAGSSGTWWTASGGFLNTQACVMSMYGNNKWNKACNGVMGGDKREGHSVRCVENEQIAAKQQNVANSFTDSRNGQIYRTVNIDGKTWMIENLNYNVNGSKCYDNNESNCNKYGRLYDWNTANIVCPSGWHLPDESDWDNLLSKMSTGSGFKMGYVSYRDATKQLKSKLGWTFQGVGDRGEWWTAHEMDERSATNISMSHDDVFVEVGWGATGQDKSDAYSVRCVLGEGKKFEKKTYTDISSNGANRVSFADIDSLHKEIGKVKVSSPDFLKDGSVKGSRSRESIQNVISQNTAALRYAYNKRVREKPDLSGKITIKFTINEFGKVISTQIVESTMSDSELETTVVSRLKSWDFEKIGKSGDMTEVIYPFDFSRSTATASAPSQPPAPTPIPTPANQQSRGEQARQAALAYERAGDDNKAAAAIEEYLKGPPPVKDQDAAYKRAQLIEGKDGKNADAAIKIYEENTVDYPRDHRNFLKAGIYYTRKNNITKAQQMFEKCVAISDTISRAWYELGMMYGSQNRDKEMLNAFNKFITIETKMVDAMLRIGEYLLVNRSMPAEAVMFLEKANALKPNDSKIMPMLGYGYLKMGKNAEAQNMAKKILSTQPESIEGLMLYGRLMVASRNFEGAMEIFKRVSSINPNYAPVLYERGNIFLMQQNYEGAKAFFERTLKLDPRYAMAELGLARLARAQRNQREYQIHLQNANRLEPGNKEIQMELNRK